MFEKAPLRSSILALGFLVLPLAIVPIWPDQYYAPKWLALYLVSLLALTYYGREKVVPKLGKLTLPIVGLVSFFILSMLSNPGNYENQILDWICFLALGLAAYKTSLQDREGLLKKVHLANSLATVVVVGYGLCQALGFQPIARLVSNGFPGSTFGFQNMTAEFLGLSILLQISQFRRSGLIAKGILLSATLALLLLTGCRSAELAVAVAIVMRLGSIAGSKSRLALGTMLSACLIGVAALSFTVPGVSNEKLRILQQTKSGNMQIRIARWRNTLAMIQDHPLGVGPGGFEFAYIPYRAKVVLDPESRPDLIIKSPHNGYLHAAASFGAPFAALMLLLIFALGRKLFRKRSIATEDERPIFDLTQGVFLFLLIDAFFAFPMELAFPFYCCAIFLGIALGLCFDSAKFQTTPLHLPARAVSIGAVLVLTALFTESKLVEANTAVSPVARSIACEGFPSNWRVCVREVEVKMLSGQVRAAESDAQRILKSSPNNYFAMQHLKMSLFFQGRIAESFQLQQRLRALW